MIKSSALFDVWRINRIRLEFKGLKTSAVNGFENRINRIRLEFKVKIAGNFFILKTVLIESDWNLKNTHDVYLKASN